MLTPPKAVFASSSHTDKLLKELIKLQKTNTILQQDNAALILNATKNTTAQLEIANLYSQNAMVENHNGMAKLLQALIFFLLPV
jgi:hypothetical protein